MDRPSDSYSQTLLKGRYRPGSVIGRGGMATVYRARDEQLGRDVAIKLFGAVPVGAESTPVFAAELRMLAALSHHGIVTLLDAGIDDSVPAEPHPYLIMELVTGPNLEEAIKAGVLSSRAIAEIGYDLAEALDYVHARGVVHRDLKPSNVMLVEYGTSDTRSRARLTDFGIAFDAAAALGPEETNTTGTAAYLSPEQVLRDLVGPASDVYALGLVLLECFTRHIEYPGDPSASAVSRLKTDPILPAELSTSWRSLLTAMLQRDPAQRPPTHDILLALRQIIIEESGRRRNRPAPIPIDETARMNAMRRYEPYARPGDEVFERVANLARRVADAPVAIVSMIDHDDIRFLAHPGTDIQGLARDDGLCSGVIADEQPWVVENCVLDPRSSEHGLVTGGFAMRFYAGVPIKSPEGYNVGVISVADFTPRTISEGQLESLVDLAALVTDELELKLASQQLRSELRQTTGDVPTPAVRYPHAV
ncbi:GAF domain-containing serine/threonine-protein kinase [Protaetiibacter intestinalis]|uniref:GAF domain-containing protein n=1 Tax=Protaetiibacter intestinalis TaxID=2419774 RepID=A0A387B0A8_9MICO|nr:protein kinase [Protaetiibacter intestinalis]AYF96904.1 GAF domain-containing protein [Protaetiibacter intestinalis]